MWLLERLILKCRQDFLVEGRLYMRKYFPLGNGLFVVVNQALGSYDGVDVG